MSVKLGSAPQIKRSSLYEQVYGILERKIIAGELLPGTRLSEESLAEEFGVSRSPVREVIAELERVGLAERDGARDRRIAIPSAKMIRDTYETWLVLVVGRTYFSSLASSEADHKQIRNALAAMEAAKRTGNLEGYAEPAEEFHGLLRSRCDNTQLLSLIKDLEKCRSWLIALYEANDHPTESSMKEHRQIARCYIQRDLLGLKDILSRHIQGQRDRLIASHERLGMRHALAVTGRRTL